MQNPFSTSNLSKQRLAQGEEISHEVLKTHVVELAKKEKDLSVGEVGYPAAIYRLSGQSEWIKGGDEEEVGDERQYALVEKLASKTENSLLPMGGIGFALHRVPSSSTWEPRSSLAITGLDWTRDVEGDFIRGSSVILRHQLTPSENDNNIIIRVESVYDSKTRSNVNNFHSPTNDWEQITAFENNIGEDHTVSLWWKSFRYGRFFLGEVRSNMNDAPVASRWLGVLGEATPKTTPTMDANIIAAFSYSGGFDLFPVDKDLSVVFEEDYQRTNALFDIDFKVAGNLQLDSAEMYIARGKWKYHAQIGSSSIPIILSDVDGRPFSFNLTFDTMPSMVEKPSDEPAPEQALIFDDGNIFAAFYGPEYNVLAGVVHLSTTDKTKHLYGVFNFQKKYIPGQ